MHSDIIKEYEKHSNHSLVIMLLYQPYTREGDYIRINGAVTTTNYPTIWQLVTIVDKYNISTTLTQYLSFTHGFDG